MAISNSVPPCTFPFHWFLIISSFSLPPMHIVNLLNQTKHDLSCVHLIECTSTTLNDTKQQSRHIPVYQFKFLYLHVSLIPHTIRCSFYSNNANKHCQKRTDQTLQESVHIWETARLLFVYLCLSHSRGLSPHFSSLWKKERALLQQSSLSSRV